MNASYVPEAKVFFGLPLMSGLAVDVNSRVSYNDMVTMDEDGNKVYDFDNFVNQSQEHNYLGVVAEISTFYLGIKPNNNTAISIFVRERISTKSFYSHDLVDFAWNGNESYIGKTLDLTNTLTDSRYYREYGLGLWKKFPKQKLEVGIRGKFLNGMVSAISDTQFSGSVTIDDDYQHQLQIKNTAVNTSGLNILEDGSNEEIQEYFTYNDNLGFGIDLGANWRINDKFSTSVAINDLGFINWKADPRNYIVADTTINFGDFSFKDADNIEDIISDSLLNKLDDSVTYKSYRSGLNTSVYASGMYHLSPKDKVTATVSSRIVQGSWRMLYAVGYTRQLGNIFSVSGNIIKKPQQGIDLGLAAEVTLGALQLYIASDQVLKSWDVPNMKSFDIQFGINFIFGRNKVSASKTQKDSQKDLEHPLEYGEGRKVEKSDGLYFIVPKQKRRPIYNE
ncbi:hypothetical protein BFP72_15600 [Reichenbachiella sp. 5M10]|nr:hypothetical protein BFP72_15600 [Reichenbachiella sp. 5M10]